MIKRLAHLCFKSDRADEMIRFYRDIMGFPAQFTMKEADGRDFGWYFALGNQSFLELFDQAGAVRKWGGEARAVEGTAGVPVGEIKTGSDNSLQCWTADPDGNRNGLMEYTPESMQLR